MNCLECHVEEKVTPAIGVCAWCGAGCCNRHGSVVTGKRSVTTGNLVQQRLVETRAVGCGPCRKIGAPIPATTLSG